MLTSEGWTEKPGQRARDARPVRSAARRLGGERWRNAVQEFIEILEAGIASAAVVALLAGATLLLIRSLAG